MPKQSFKQKRNETTHCFLYSAEGSKGFVKYPEKELSISFAVSLNTCVYLNMYGLIFETNIGNWKGLQVLRRRLLS